jgi:hypothetical protein
MAGLQIPLSEEWGVFVEKAVRGRGYAGGAGGGECSSYEVREAGRLAF